MEGCNLGMGLFWLSHTVCKQEKWTTGFSDVVYLFYDPVQTRMRPTACKGELHYNDQGTHALSNFHKPKAAMAPLV